MQFRSIALFFFGFLLCAESAFAQKTLITFSGNSPSSFFGHSVQNGGDFNQDGFPDLIVGAFNESGILPNSGRVRVYSGKDAQLMFDLTGNSAHGHFGLSTSGTGDVNGDGIADFIVGASGTIPGGEGFVFSGKDAGILYHFQGISYESRLGQSVSGPGDLNGDGFADLLVGAPGENSNAGTVYVFSGKDGSTLFSFHGNAPNDRLGQTVSKAGDVNGDGVPDLLAGADQFSFTSDGAGYARVFSGSNGSILYQFDGTIPGGGFGSALDGPGDVNQDGFADILIGDPAFHPTATSIGAARLYSGKNGTLLYLLFGSELSGILGETVSGAGDVDHDGFPDLIVGDYGNSAFGSNSGLAVIFSGKDGSTMASLFGGSAGKWFGRAVAGAGDVDQDGFDDVIVGAPASGNGFAKIFSIVPKSISNFGEGCPGNFGVTPQLALSGFPSPGLEMKLALYNVFGGSSGVILFGTGQSAIPMKGACSLQIAPLIAANLAFKLAGWEGQQSSFLYSDSIPNDNALVGACLTLQAFLYSPFGTTPGLSASKAIQLIVQ